MNRSELIRRMVLNAMCDDFENIDQIILPVVARDCAKLGLAVERAEIVKTVSDLVMDGLVKAYDLSGTNRDPFSGELPGMPAVDIVEEDFKTYFYPTKREWISICPTIPGGPSTMKTTCCQPGTWTFRPRRANRFPTAPAERETAIARNASEYQRNFRSSPSVPESSPIENVINARGIAGAVLLQPFEYVGIQTHSHQFLGTPPELGELLIGERRNSGLSPSYYHSPSARYPSPNPIMITYMLV
jgi:hypothetical protein